MNVLWVPQISSLSADGKVLLDKDSNMAVLRNMVGSRFSKDCDFTLAFEFSKRNTICDIEYLEWEFHCEVVFDESRYFTNAKFERFSFNPEYFEMLKDEHGPFDIVFVNEPTKVIPLKAIFPESKVVTYNHWLAFKNMPEISLRQYEGMLAADMCFVNSNYTIEQILLHYKDFDGVENLKLKKMQPSFSSQIETLTVHDKLRFKGMNAIYNHRLSSDKYYADAFENLVEVCDLAEEAVGVSDMPTIYFTNPSGKDIKHLMDRKPYFVEKRLDTPKEYMDFLKSEDIKLHLNTFFDSEGMWSMSTVDCAIAGNICLLPNKFGYAEIFKDTYAGYCSSVEEMAYKFWNLILCYQEAYRYSCESVNKHNGMQIGNKLYDCLHDLLYAEENERPWGNYEVLYAEKKFKNKLLNVEAGESLSLQKHMLRNEEWNILEGEGIMTLGDSRFHASSLSGSISIPAGIEHKFEALSYTIIVENAYSDVVVSESDIIRLEDMYGRA